MKFKFTLLTIIMCLLSFGLQAQTVVGGNSEINQCETNTYTISVTNSSGGPLTGIVVTAHMVNLTDFSFLTGTASLDVDGGAAFCTANPTPSGTDLIWNIDSLCPGPFTLNNGETLNVSFDLATGCNAVSGSLNVTFDSNETAPDATGVLNIQVNPGAVIIRKEATVIPQTLGGNVTWTLTVENTGFGVIENVFVTDVMGAGLTYVSSTQSGNNSGQTTTWSSAEYPALASMDPGDILTMDITATVTACDNLDNTADVRFGCIPGAGNACFDTSVDGGTARASVQRIVRTPVIAFTPPNVNFTYCDDTENISFTITNNGDGIAYDVYTIVDFTGFTVSNVSAGAIYNVAQTRFELAAPLAATGDPGDSYSLSFDLTYNSWCGGSFPSGDLLWQKLYKDECDQEFYPPVELSAINAPTNSSSLAVAKTGAPSQIEIGGNITYNVTSSYTGQLNCDSPSNPTSAISVVDTLPAGLVITSNPDGGVWNAGARTLTWTYTPPATLNISYSVDVPDASQCETYCNTTFTNSVVASGTDCCGCAISASASQTTAIECAEGVTSDKTSSSPTERCEDTTYTNTYVFDGGSAVVLSDLIFTEQAELNQEYVFNSVSVNLSGIGDITGSAFVTDNTPTAGGNGLILDFSGAASTSLAGRTLTITYDLTATAATLTACTGSSFYSWSALSLGPSGSSCLGDGIIHETTEVSLGSPGMSLSISGLGQIYNTCETKTITLTLTQTTDYNPKDVKLVLSGLNYFVVNPGSVICGGTVSPVLCNPTIGPGGDYIWTFDDNFNTNGGTATITIDVQKRCTGGGTLNAIAYFDDACTDDATADELCSVSGSETPALLLTADLLIEKTPETYYATTNTVQWEIYVTNRGTGTAYNVWVDDVLGSGLLYEHGVNPVVVDNMTGVTINDSLDHNGGAINGASVEILEMAAGERRQITFIAKQVDCTGLTNDVTTNWGCIAVDCQTDVTDNSIVQIPAPNLINTNTITPAAGIDACENPNGFITLKNAGQIYTYNLQVTETLPTGLEYVSGTTRWRLNGGGWNGPNVIYDPNPTTSPLVWTSTEIPQLASAAPGDTIEIEFDMVSDCPFNGGDITVTTQYENPCATVFNTAASTFTTIFNAPDIVVDKTRANDPIGCNEAIQWTITVTNNSGYQLPIIWVEDTMDAAFTFVSSVGDATYGADNGDQSGQNINWELRNVPHGATATIILNATSDSAPCSPDLDNTVVAYWGCGAADGDSATEPGVDAPDNTLCKTSSGTQDVRTETREPDMGFLNIGLSPATIDSCNESTTLTVEIENSGPVDASNIDLVIDLPAGITYNAGTSETGLGTDSAGAIAVLAGVGDPAITGGGSTLTWYDIGDKINNIANTIQADGGNDTLALRFTVQSNCYTTADLDFTLYYYDCCDDTQWDTTDSKTLTATFPDLAVTKTANVSQVDCASPNVTYTIQVTNNGTGNAEVVRVVDTLGDWLDYAGSFTEDQPGTITPALIGADPQIIGWEFNDLGPGATATFTFEATLNPDTQNTCATTPRENNVSAQWACGTAGDAIDDNPNTITDYDCTNSGSAATDGPVTMEMPNLVVTSITPSISCTTDGNFSGSVTVRVTNTGDGDSIPDFTVQVTDGQGGTFTGLHSGTINGGGTNYADVTIDVSGWAIDCCANYSFIATADLNNDVCECNETDNDNSGSPQAYTASIPDLVINSITPTCTADGLSQVVVNVGNTGCGNLPASFTLNLSDDQGNTADQTVTTLNAGANTNVTFSNWSTACSPATINFTATADTGDDVCECDTVHSLTVPYNNPSPNLVVSTITPLATCTVDGTVSGTIQVQVSNSGNGAVNADFDILVNDGQGWTDTVSFQGDLGGSLPMNAGTNQTVTIPWTRSFTSAPYVCSFPSISVTVDSGTDICECTNASNASTTSYTLPQTNLRVLSVTPSCTSDGTYSIGVLVGNNGCANAANVTVRLSDNDGNSQDQTVSLNAGAQQTVTFSSWPADGNPASLLFTAAIDPGNAFCELSGTDNSDTETYDVGNLNLVSITPACGSDDTFSVALVVENNGAAAINTDFVVRLSDNDGHSSDQNFTAIGGTLPLNASSQQTVTFNNWTVDCNPTTINFTGTLDPTSLVCESNSTDNGDTGSITINDLEAVSVTALASCAADGSITGTMQVAVANRGGNAINTDFYISVNDGQGWNAELRYNADLGGTLPIGTGATETVTFNWTRSFTATPYVCDFTSISATVDSQGDLICECTNSNNSTTGSYSLPFPNLRVLSVVPTFNCAADGSLTGNVAVTVDNNGCDDSAVASVQLTSTGSYTFTNQTVTLTEGSSTVLNFSFTPTAPNCDVDFTATIDPGSAVCELTAGDNAVTYSNFTPDIPDLNVSADTLALSCNDDGIVAVNGNITVQNSGCGSFTTDIPVRFTLYDGTGCSGTTLGTWTDTLTSVSINGGSTQSFTVSQLVDTNASSYPANCTLSIGVELDYGTVICEYDGTNNSYCANNKAVDIPELETASNTLGVTCVNDGEIQVSGGVTIVNNGCGTDFSGSIPVRFTLYNNTGCTGTALSTWTDTLSGGTLQPGAANSHSYTINTHNVTTNLVDQSNNCQVSVMVELDYGDTICELNGTNNTYCADNIPVDIPDLEYTSDTLAVISTGDGTAQVSGSITVINNGCGSNMTSDIPVRITLYDNINCTGNQISQWTDTFTSSNIAANGGTQTYTIVDHPLTGNMCNDSTSCQVSMRIELDYSTSICESDGTDNEACVDKTVSIPELTIDAVASSVTCLSDGSLTGTTVTVSNTGCADANNVTVRLASDCGLTFSDEIINITAGQTIDVFFAFTAGITTCSCTFSAEIDPDDTIMECDGTNNTGTSVATMLISDIEVQSENLTLTCADDGVIRASGTVTLVNNGCGPNLTSNIPMRFTLFGNSNCSGTQVDQWTYTFRGVNIASAGGTQTFTIENHDITANFCTDSTNCMMSLLIEADYTDSICEWDGTDNTYCSNKTSDCLDLEAVKVAIDSTCSSDGNFNSTMAVTVRNNGGKAITEDFSIKLDDGMGWTSEKKYSASLGGTLPLAVGAEVTVTFDWDRTLTVTTCDFSTITATVDSLNEICQCTTTNDTVTTSANLEHPNLKPTEITPTCSDDGTYTVQVTYMNDGCADLPASTFIVRLKDDQGNTMDKTVTIDGLPKGQSLTLDFTGWPSTCEPPVVVFTATVDAGLQVCEIDGTDNSMNFSYSDPSPDLIITSVIPVTSISSTGNVSGTFDCTITNQGNAPATQDFKVKCDDGEGWTTEKFYQAELGGSLPLAVGASVTVNVPWTRNFSSKTCDYNNIVVGLDVTTGVCECAAGNNETTITYSLPYPDLSIDTLEPVCTADGIQKLDMVISNNGCDDRKDDFTVTITDSTGKTQTIPFTQLGGKLPLKAGDSQTVTFTEWPFDCSTNSITYTATLNVEGNDMVSTNNTISVNYNYNAPDLKFSDVEWTCNNDGTISFKMTVVNSGNGASGSAPVTIYDNNNEKIFTGNVNLAAGASTELNFTSGVYPTGTSLIFRFVVDETFQACECDGNNNETIVTVNCTEQGNPELEITIDCGPGQRPGGLFTFSINVKNTGETDIYNTSISDLLPAGFTYVPGKSVFAGELVNATVTGLMISWEIGNLAVGQMGTLTFQAIADADIDPGRYCSEAWMSGNSASVNGTEVMSPHVTCCTVVTLSAGAGCCLDIEEFPIGMFRKPDGPVSYIEPYFHTETAMFTVYSIFNLWKDKNLEDGSMPRFMRERLHNYARSTMEEFYFNSGLGLRLPDGALWMSLGGAYPEKEKNDQATNAWIRKSVDKTVTVSQMAFELLALNQSVKAGKDETIKTRLLTLIDKKIEFLAHFIHKLPHGWQVDEKAAGNASKDNNFEGIRKLNSSAGLYDRASLYLSLTELGNKELASRVREMLKSIDDRGFDRNNLPSEFLFMLALLQSGEEQLAKDKMAEFEKIFSNHEEGSDKIESLHDYAMALYLSRKLGSSITGQLLQQMKDKFYLKDTGIFAEKQPDLTFKLNLHSLAPLMLAFNSEDDEQVKSNSTVLYRTFDEVGLFLKKRNLNVGKPLYSLLKNYPFAEAFLPVLNFTKGNRTIAPVFSRDAIVHSTLLKPIGEAQIPASYSKLLSPGYQTDSSRIASLSFGLQYVGGQLSGMEQQVVQEEGRSFIESGKKYFTSLLTGGDGLLYNGYVLVPFDKVAIKGSSLKNANYHLEPLNSGIDFSTRVFADYMVAAQRYVGENSKHSEAVTRLLSRQLDILKKLKTLGTIPQRFALFIDSAGTIAVSASKEPADKLTIAKLFSMDTADEYFYKKALKKSEGKLDADDLLFLSSLPRLADYFKAEIQAVIDLKDSKVSHNAADIIGRRLLDKNDPQIEKSLNNLNSHWDKESVWLKPDRIDNIERGLIYRHEPRHFLLYLTATAGGNSRASGFRFKRTLNFFTYMMENEWGVQWDNSNGFISLPSNEYQVFKEEPKEHAEPGDLVSFRVKVDNTCPEGFGSAFDLSSLFINATFVPAVVYAGTEKVDGLEVVSDFKWKTNSFVEGSLLEYTYQAYLTPESQYSFFDARIAVNGRRGFGGFGVESQTGDDCDDIHTLSRINILPFDQLQGVVYEDRNVNGIKDPNEPGIPNIQVKDTRGRMFRSDAEGRFSVLAGDEHEGVQIELRSVPGNFLMLNNPTRLVNRRYKGIISFGLVPCATVTGFVYDDTNGNGSWDEGEKRPEGVVIRAKDKEVLTGKDGMFTFRNLPDLWKQYIEVKNVQPFYKGSIDNFKLSADK